MDKGGEMVVDIKKNQRSSETKKLDDAKTMFLRSLGEVTEKRKSAEGKVTGVEKIIEELEDLGRKLFLPYPHSLEKTTKELYDYKAALLNMLEDLNESRIKLEESYKELAELDKMKSDFIQIAVHELRTPLIAVKSGVELVNTGELGSLTSKQKEALGLAEQNIDVITALIDDMLDIMRIKSGKIGLMKESLSIKELVGLVANGLKPVFVKKKQKVTVKIPDSVSNIIGDPYLLAKVFNNLLGNAIKYTPDNGKITISAEDDGRKIHCAVTDTGVGIPKKEIDKIFDMFYVVDSSMSRKHKGVGLGLAICKGIMEAHNGKIWVESNTGKGSTFHVTLPKNEVKK